MEESRTAPQPVDMDNWQAWHPAECAKYLGDLAAPWYVAGGWALDLWHGAKTRAHEDLEIVALRNDTTTFRNALSHLDFFEAHKGQLSYLPAHKSPAKQVSQLWGLDRATKSWKLDLMIEEGTPSTWVYKRNHVLTAARNAMVQTTPSGIPYLTPIAVLLFKAKHLRPKDQLDFETALPKLATSEKDRLKSWLVLEHPSHIWLNSL